MRGLHIEHLKEFIEIDELSEEKFSIEMSVNRAKEILDSLKEVDEVFDGEFEDDKWTFEKHLVKGSTVVFNFAEIENIAEFNDYWNSSSVVVIKCWIAELLSEYYPSSVHTKLNVLLKIIAQTNFFSQAKVTDFVESLRNYSPAIQKSLEEKEAKDLEYFLEELKENTRGLQTVKEIIVTTLNFLTFSELDSFHFYNNPLIDIKKGLPNVKFVRQIPTGKDVLKLDNAINRYFVNGFSGHSNLFFAPILLWWKITNIIPMRISEFCTIKRKCISMNNGRYYITLPREKQPATQRKVQIVDTLEITRYIYEMIDNYIELTNQYGESETLISFRSILALEVKNTTRVLKKNYSYFSRQSFESLLRQFYKDIVYGEYKKTVEREVRPNDTRHFAFCSLLMQGISPIEIARLGGHSTIEAQYHYSNHTEYFIDIEIKKLIDGFVRKDGELKGTSLEGHEITFQNIEENSLQFPSKDNSTRLPVEIGFCTDELQSCESEECMLCKNWWIHPEMLLKVKPQINKKIIERKQKIIELGNFLKNLNESVSTEMHKQNKVHPNFFTKLKTEANSIQAHLEEIARLEIIKGDIDHE